MNKIITIALLSIALLSGTVMIGNWVEAENEKQKFENLKATVIELNDDKVGNDLGWNPDGETTTFSLFEAEIPFMAGPIPMSYNIFEKPGSLTSSQCYAPVKTSTRAGDQYAVISCETAPPEDSSLRLVFWTSE